MTLAFEILAAVATIGFGCVIAVLLRAAIYNHANWPR